MERIEDVYKEHSYWIKRYSLVQLGSYFVSFISYIIYLLPTLNNDTLLFSYLVSNISLLRLRIYLNDVIAFVPKNKNLDKNINSKKLIIFIFLIIVNNYIFLNIAEISIFNSIIITFSMALGIYITFLNNYNLHDLIRKNKLSKKNLFLFGFIPRSISTLFLFLYVLIGEYYINENLVDLFRLFIILAMYIMPALIHNLYIFKDIRFRNFINI